MMTLTRLARLVQKNRIDYESILKDYRVLRENISEEEQDIVVLIPTMNREDYLRTVLRYMNAAAQQSKYKIHIIVVEQNDTMACREIAKEANAGYLWMPLQVTKLNCFIKSLCFNVGYLAAPKSKWILAHDSDIVVSTGFFKLKKDYLDGRFFFIQPYNDRRVRRLTDASTKRVMESDKILNLWSIGDFELHGQGATGGSVFVRSSLFEKVGGYDPELFYGWGPEDVFFWMKMESLCGPTRSDTTSAHQGNACYVPDQQVWHLEHPRLWESNPHLIDHNELYNSFCHMPPKMRQIFIGWKSKQHDWVKK